MELLAPTWLPALTSREREVANLLLLGRDSPAMATKLKVSLKRIEAIRACLSKKLGVRNGVGLALWLRRENPKRLVETRTSVVLTSREETVVNLVRCGLENEDIAARISGRGKPTEGTVEDLLYFSNDYEKQHGGHDSIFKRLGVNKRVQLALLQEDRLYSAVIDLREQAIQGLRNWAETHALGEDEIARQVEVIYTGCRYIFIALRLTNDEVDSAYRTELLAVLREVQARQKLKQMTDEEKDAYLRECAAQEARWQDSQFAPMA